MKAERSGKLSESPISLIASRIQAETLRGIGWRMPCGKRGLPDGFSFLVIGNLYYSKTNI